MSDHKTLGIDLETFSEIDIMKCGSFRYIDDDSFEVLLFGYSWDGAPAVSIDLTHSQGTIFDIPFDVQQALTDPAITKTAWNAAFERYALWKHTGNYMPPEQWEDTMILAGVCGLPLKLEKACEALHLSEDDAKMKVGKRLITYFCKPCRPTAANDFRVRNLPSDAPEDWKLFMTYNARDVDVEGLIRKRLIKFKPDETEHQFWCLDARINEKGIRPDLDLVHQAIRCDELSKEPLIEEARAISGLSNPNSTSQIKAWLKDLEGIEVESLEKKVVGDVIAQLKTPEAKRFMELRAQLAKSSVSKYDAMLRSASPKDTHIRGCFQFYGANRTGRFAGRLVQLQNLPQNHIPDLEDARNLVKAGDIDTLDTLFDGVAPTLSELIRTALIPEEGHRFIVSDFSAIEARVIAWFAHEEHSLETFRNGGDIYCSTASMMFHVPVVKHGINGHLRQKGKVATLACIAEGQLVLTDYGLLPIEQVTTYMKVWDGRNWVRHEGLIDRGFKEVITYEGLTATPDHVVYATTPDGEAWEVPLEFAATFGLHLVQTGDGWMQVWLGGNHLAGKTLDQSEEKPLLRSDEMYWVRRGPVAALGPADIWKIKRVPELFTEKERTKVVVQKNDRGQRTVREPERPDVSSLRSPWNSVQFPEHKRVLLVPDESLLSAETKPGDRPDRHERELRTWEPSDDYPSGEHGEPTDHSSVGVGPEVLAVWKNYCVQEALGRNVQRRSDRGREESSPGQAEELAYHRGKVRVYDLRNAGPHHRYTVSGKLVHNCGYGGGVKALEAFGADKMGMSQEEMQDTVTKWREASPGICRLWSSMEDAAIKAITRKTVSHPAGVDNVEFSYEDGILFLQLPSGRRIAYWEPKYERSKWDRNGRKSITYMGLNDKNQWAKTETWGGKLVENLVQATARDILRDKMLEMERQGFDIRAHVHDEVIITEPVDGRTLEEVNAIMDQPVDWAPGLPLRGDGYCCNFYMKD